MSARTTEEIAAECDEFATFTSTLSGDARDLYSEAAARLRKLEGTIDVLRAALGEADEVLALCTTRDFPAPEDAEVRALGERIGFGALISAASKGWAESNRKAGVPEGAQHTHGPCAATVERALEQIRAARDLVRIEGAAGRRCTNCGDMENEAEPACSNHPTSDPGEHHFIDVDAQGMAIGPKP